MIIKIRGGAVPGGRVPAALVHFHRIAVDPGDQFVGVHNLAHNHHFPFQPSMHLLAEPIHALPEFREPMHRVPMVRRDPRTVSLTVAGDVRRREPKLPAERHAQLHGIVPRLFEIHGVALPVLRLADLKPDVGIVRALPRVRMLSRMPAPHRPGQILHHHPVVHKSVYAFFHPRLVPPAVPRLRHHPRRRRRMHHDPLHTVRPVLLVTVVLRHILNFQLHSSSLCQTCSRGGSPGGTPPCPACPR